jgi:hypothetical protein
MVIEMLTEDEKTKISQTAADLKFHFDTKNLYEIEEINKIELFLRCYRFIRVLKDSEKIVDVNIKNKLKKVLEEYEKIYVDGYRVILRHSSKREYGKSKTIRDAKEFLIINIQKIESLQSEVFVIGRKIKMFDIDSGEIAEY